MKRKSLPTGRDFLFVEGYGNENPGAFQSPRPLRGATCLGVTRAHYIKFQSTRPLRGATTFFTSHNSFIKISSHAPLAGRDGASHGWKHRYRHFNPRAPCGARQSATVQASVWRNFNPRAPCGARLCSSVPSLRPRYISIHAPLAGRDSKSVQITMHIFAITDKFQMLLHRMPPVRAFCSFLMQENHADFGCEPPK